MGAPFKSSTYGSPGWKTQKMQVETKSSTAWWNSDDQVSSSSQNNEACNLQLERGVTGKILDGEKISSHCKDKSSRLQSGIYSPDNCAPGINIVEEMTQNSKVRNPTGLSEPRTGFCVFDMPPDTVVIVDDDTDTRVNNCDKSSSGEQEDDISTEMKSGHEFSDANAVSDDSDTGCDYSYRRKTNWFYWKNMGQSPNCSRQVYLSTDVSDDEDDCQVFEPCSPLDFNAGTAQKQQKRSSSGHFRFILDSDSDSSDCEIFENSEGQIRQKWEEAALRKRVKKGTEHKQCEVGVKASMFSSNIATDSSVREGGPEVATDRKDAGFESCSAGEGTRDPSDFSNGSGINESSHQMDGDTFRTSEERDTVCPSTSGPNMTDGAVPGQDHIENEISSCTRAKDANASNKEEALNKSSPENSHCQSQKEENPVLKEIRILGGAKTESVLNENTGDWVCDREKLKETAEFRSADEEEWNNRQLELERQAKEVQQLRRRKRAEAERMLEMERRQRRRLEEIRITQKKEEQTMDQKEKLRDQVRSRLEELASTCKDMASLLRSLGIPVDGGSLPSSQQVNAAYKKALLRFHPDRASTLNDGVSHQVEAEETFKMISQMKSTLSPVVTGYGNKTGW